MITRLFLFVNEGIKENTGYLLFEDKEGKTALISAETLGDMLNRQKIALIVLSACQSAQIGEDAMGSVAARLTHAGIPSVYIKMERKKLYFRKGTGNRFLENLPYNMFRVSFFGRKWELWQIETAFVRKVSQGNGRISAIR